MNKLIVKFRAVAQYIRIVEHLIEAHYISEPTANEKPQNIRRWSHMYGGLVFIETGTWRGNTTFEVAPYFDRCFTIELDPNLFAKARERFKETPKVTVLHGSSVDVLPLILADLGQPGTFYLDAHYCGFDTAKGSKNTPILEELKIIFNHRIKNHLIIIDDARAFVGLGDYPTIRKLGRFVRTYGPQYKMIIQNDAVVIFVENQ